MASEKQAIGPTTFRGYRSYINTASFVLSSKEKQSPKAIPTTTIHTNANHPHHEDHCRSPCHNLRRRLVRRSPGWRASYQNRPQPVRILCRSQLYDTERCPEPLQSCRHTDSWSRCHPRKSRQWVDRPCGYERCCREPLPKIQEQILPRSEQRSPRPVLLWKRR